MRLSNIGRIGALAALLLLTGSAARADKKDRNTYQAERTGWLLGLKVGEGSKQPYQFVISVDADSDAQRQGIRPGDELVRIDDVETQPFKPLFERVSAYSVGRLVRLYVRRGGQTLAFRIQVPRRPLDEDEDTVKPAEKKSDGKDGDSKDAKNKKKKKKAAPKPPPVELP